MKELLFETKGIGKTYGTNTVLHDIDMKVYSGEVIGLIGENGAGKSTLMKLICGAEKPSMGSMYLRGEEYHSNSILESNHQGIGMVFQEQSLVGALTIAQNIFLGREKKYSKAGFVNWAAMNQDAKKTLGQVGLNFDPNKKVRDLDFAARQMVEIAKVLNVVTESAEGHAVILLDEPTTVLSNEEIENLFKQIERMKKEGNAVIFISHRLDEVLKVTDRIYVFKDGACTADMNTKDADESVLYEKMVGRSTTGEFYHEDRQTAPSDDVVLEVNDLSLFGIFNHVGFKLKKGEVLGLCGVEGSGKEALCSVLMGDEGQTSGTMSMDGREVTFKNPCKARRSGIICVPKERRDEGIIGILSISDNIVISHMEQISSRGYVSGKKMKKISSDWVQKLKIKCVSINDRINQLSGGNAQKVIFARALESGCHILILNHPTRGVDVGSKEEIYSLIRDITEKGNSVILLGDTLDECIGMSSRIIVLKDGVISGEFDFPAGEKPSQFDIVKMMM
ncbi:MAG TPA: sugar ABC transporter ATP-binding protein [Ruminococcaceae bacterium]|jgi:ribose transport system ATP-binding protein|nr:sugar ABC transporter ATP-binding protein [Oscillospiraceae bacterium]